MSLSCKTSSSTLQRYINPSYIDEDTRKVLLEIHREIYNLSTRENFSEGWKIIEERNSRCSTIAYKTFAVTGGIFAVSFSATSIMFGTLAGLQGVEDYKEGVNPYVMGHLSEWTMQGLFSLGVVLEVFNEIALLGGQSKARKIFHKFFQENKLSNDQRRLIYQDYLAFFRSQPQNYFISLPQLPILPKKLPIGQPNNLLIDHQLRDIYIKIEHELLNIPTLSNIRKGWSIVKANKSQCTMALLKTTMAVGSLFLTFHVANYAMSIYWAGKQSYNDYQEEVNPNVGGHSLEWSVEALATANLIIYYMNELANVGKVKTIMEVFQSKIDFLKEDSCSYLAQARERLHKHMGEQIKQLPQGWFFNIPSWLMFNAKESTNQEV